jgi:hypothetical protein
LRVQNRAENSVASPGKSTRPISHIFCSRLRYPENSLCNRAETHVIVMTAVRLGQGLQGLLLLIPRWPRSLHRGLDQPKYYRHLSPQRNCHLWKAVSFHSSHMFFYIHVGIRVSLYISNSQSFTEYLWWSNLVTPICGPNNASCCNC